MQIIHDEEFRAWEADTTDGERGDPVWKFHSYRVALYMLHLAGRDARVLQERRVLAFQTDQLLRAVASISANIAEGLGRQSTTERSRFFGIALGSVREAITWYHAVADELPAGAVPKRFEQLTELRMLLIGAQKWLSSRPQGARLM